MDTGPTVRLRHSPRMKTVQVERRCSAGGTARPTGTPVVVGTEPLVITFCGSRVGRRRSREEEWGELGLGKRTGVISHVGNPPLMRLRRDRGFLTVRLGLHLGEGTGPGTG